MVSNYQHKAPRKAALGAGKPFQSPCAGNMFGKETMSQNALRYNAKNVKNVSIPVCGEHVW